MAASANEVELDMRQQHMRQRQAFSDYEASDAATEDDAEDDAVLASSYFGRQGPPPLTDRRRLPIKTTIAAGSLLFLGVVFLISGLVVFLTYSLSEALPYLIIGGIGFIPGSYNSVMIYRTYMGYKGYSYSQIPSYDD